MNGYKKHLDRSLPNIFPAARYSPRSVPIAPLGTVHYSIPGFGVKRQEQTLWCWAAIAQAAIRHISKQNVDQCIIATKYCSRAKISLHPFRNCCSPAGSRACNQAASLTDVFDANSIPYLWAGVGQLAAGAVIFSIMRQMIVICRVSAHFVAISSCKIVNEEVFLTVHDPDDGQSRLKSYREFSQPRSGYTWNETYKLE